MKYSLFIGRFQPFHNGHRAQIDKLLSEGKNVCIAIRRTEHSESDPYPAMDRFKMIRTAYPAYAFPNVEVIIIPDIEEVVYGRDVGYKIREVRLDEDTESISATKIRESQK